MAAFLYRDPTGNPLQRTIPLNIVYEPPKSFLVRGTSIPHVEQLKASFEVDEVIWNLGAPVIVFFVGSRGNNDQTFEWAMKKADGYTIVGNNRRAAIKELSQTRPLKWKFFYGHVYLLPGKEDKISDDWISTLIAFGRGENAKGEQRLKMTWRDHLLGLREGLEQRKLKDPSFIPDRNFWASFYPLETKRFIDGKSKERVLVEKSREVFDAIIKIVDSSLEGKQIESHAKFGWMAKMTPQEELTILNMVIDKKIKLSQASLFAQEFQAKNLINRALKDDLKLKVNDEDLEGELFAKFNWAEPLVDIHQRWITCWLQDKGSGRKVSFRPVGWGEYLKKIKKNLNLQSVTSQQDSNTWTQNGQTHSFLSSRGESFWGVMKPEYHGFPWVFHLENGITKKEICSMIKEIECIDLSEDCVLIFLSNEAASIGTAVSYASNETSQKFNHVVIGQWVSPKLVQKSVYAICGRTPIRKDYRNHLFPQSTAIIAENERAFLYMMMVPLPPTRIISLFPQSNAVSEVGSLLGRSTMSVSKNDFVLKEMISEWTNFWTDPNETGFALNYLVKLTPFFRKFEILFS